MTKDITDYEVIKFLLFQQFYYGDDIIYGRTRDVSVVVRGSGEIIEKFYINLVEQISLIRQHQYKDYLQYFNDFIFPINTKDIYIRFKGAYDNIEKDQLTPQIITSFLLSEILVEIRKKCFDEALNEIKIILIEKVTKFNKELDTEKKLEISEDFVVDKMNNLKQLFSLNDGNIGIIYNLSFLKTLAYKYTDMKVYNLTKKMLLRYMENVVEKIY